MDNVTHTLVGIAVGRTFARPHSKLYQPLLWSAIIGNNLPDIDFLLSSLFSEKKLGYLLHHRGYTHTLLAAVPLGIFSAVFGTIISKDLKIQLNRTDWLKLVGIGVLSVFLHIGADFCNNYGVHPFTPFWDRWFYGDILFIIEPLIWFPLIPYVIMTSKKLVYKLLAMSLALLLLALGWFGPFIPWKIGLTMSAGMVISFWIQKTKPSLLYVWISLSLVFGSFIGGAFAAKKRISSLYSFRRDIQIRQIVTTPAPGNPFCQAFTVLFIENGTDYVAQLGITSLIPYWIRSATCYLPPPQDRAVDLQKILTPIEGVTWIGEFRRSLGEFTSLRNTNCHFREFLRFSRIPAWFTQNNRMHAVDLRYDNARNGGFSGVDLSLQTDCKNRGANWEPPTRNIQ